MNGRYEEDQGKGPLSNRVTEPAVGSLKVRGKNYLSDKKKIPSAPPMFRLFDCKCYTYKEGLEDVAGRIKPLKEFLSAHPDHEFFIINRMLPTKPWRMVVEMYARAFEASSCAAELVSVVCRDVAGLLILQGVAFFPIFRYERPKASRGPPHFERLWKRFREEDDAFRNARFKYLFALQNAGFMVRSAVSTLGGFRPVILGKGYLEMKYSFGDNYVEVVALLYLCFRFCQPLRAEDPQ